MKNVEAKSEDPNAAYIAANAFFGLAGGFFSQLPDDLNAAAQLVNQKRGQLIAAVTNLALAIELYFKSLAIVAGVKVHKTHDLLTLFKALPKPLVESIEMVYDLKRKQMPPHALAPFQMIITSTPISQKEEED